MANKKKLSCGPVSEKKITMSYCTLLPHPKLISGRWILVPFGDSVSQTHVLYFARINVVSARILGGQLPPSLLTTPRPVREFFFLTMFRQQSQYDSRLRFSSRVLVRVRVSGMVRLGLGLELVIGLGLWFRASR